MQTAQTKTQTICHFTLNRQKDKQNFNLTRFLLIGLVFILVGTVNSYATDYYQRQSGNWNSPNTWTTNAGYSTPANIGTFPQAGDNVHIANNGMPATITLTEDAECANLYFDNSCTTTVIVMGDYDLTVLGSWTSDEGNQGSITQTTGFLQINGGIGTIEPGFKIAKTINNLRVGSPSFSMTKYYSTSIVTVTSNYDFNCLQSTIPTGVDASAASKQYTTPCSPTLIATTLADFGNICTSSTSDYNSFNIRCLALNTTNITVAALNGFSYSTTSGGTYTNTLSIPQSGGNNSKTIYVKFSPSTLTSYNGNIVLGGGGSTNKNVAATGSGSNAVVPKIANSTAVVTSSTSAKFGATITVSSCTGSVNERGFYYSTTNGFADGTGTKVSEAGTFGTGIFSLDASGLSTSTTYYYKAFATNETGTSYSTQATFNNNPTTYYSRQSGNWTNPTTWTTTGCGGSINTGTYPGAVDNVIICQQHNITVNTTGLSCNNLNMSNYKASLILNNDFKINGNLLLTSQSYISAGTKSLTIMGDFTNTPNEFDSRIDYSSGNITIDGNIIVARGGVEPFNCTGTGWLTMSGTSKTFTANSNISIPKFIQPENGFSKGGSGTITISNIFDRNWGPEEPTGVIISIPANTIHIPTPYYKSTTNGNWNNTSTWLQSNNGGGSWFAATSTPTDADALVIIQNSNIVTLTTNASIKGVIINANSTLNVNANKQLTLSNNLTNNGTLKLMSDATGTATLLTNGTIDGSGNYKVQQYFPTARNWYLSSPLSDALAQTGYTYYKYDEPCNNTGYIAPATANWEAIPTGTTFIPMTGYIGIPPTGPSTVEFSGTSLNNGNKSIVVSRTAGKYKEGFNLIGNPYPSYINYDAATRTNVEPTIWYRTKNTSGTFVFDTYNGVGTNNNGSGAVTGYIPPMQSFWIRVAPGKTAGSISFTNAMRLHEIGTNKLKAPANSTPDNKILRLQVSNSVNADETVLKFNTNASSYYDTDDAQKMTNGNAVIPEIFTIADNEELVINSMDPASLNTEIPLGFRTGETNNFIIKASEISNFDENTHIILKDNILNSETDLSIGEIYNFNSGATTTTNRFSLIFRTSSITTTLNSNSTNNSAIVYKDANGSIVVKVNNLFDKDATITVYNSTGQKITNYPITSQTTVINHHLNPGIYLVNININSKTTTKKIILE